MSATIMSQTTLGTSNVRGGPSRLTRSNPARATKVPPTSFLRQSSLLASAATGNGLPLASVGAGPAASENHHPPGLYPAITRFSDAIAALPREYRRHVTLLREVDAKAWEPEQNLQNVLDEILVDLRTTPAPPRLSSMLASDDAAVHNISEVNSNARFLTPKASMHNIHIARNLVKKSWIPSATRPLQHVVAIQCAKICIANSKCMHVHIAMDYDIRQASM